MLGEILITHSRAILHKNLSGINHHIEDVDFDSAWAIGAVLLVLVLAINLAARLAKTKLKQKQ